MQLKRDGRLVLTFSHGSRACYGACAVMVEKCVSLYVTSLILFAKGSAKIDKLLLKPNKSFIARQI